MSKYRIKIELLSDMCVSDGGVYNSFIDIDICHDKYGFPYIPAKRLKGCLRECALELNDWGMDIPLNKIFGDIGESGNRGALRLGNAELEDIDGLHKIVDDNPSVVYHPQNVLSVYTSIRNQTGIDYDTGAAQQGSLRSMRVVNRGTVFYSDFDICDEYLDGFTACVTALSQLGMNRTRGLGEVVASVETCATSVTEEPHINNAEYIKYTITLLEPLICKSINGGEARSLDYIEGSKMLGLIASKVKSANQDFSSFTERGKLRCTNAYISEDGIRYEEVYGNLYSIKNKKTPYVDKYVANSSTEQINPMKHCYIHRDKDGTINKRTVRLEERYHHRRPDDKSIGRAIDDESDNSKFYQISSIEAGQCFSGYIYGSAEQISQISELFATKEQVNIGYSNASEYGKANIEFEAITANKKCVTADEIVVNLLAPTIVYNQRAMYAVDSNSLMASIAAVLGIACDDIVSYEKYVKYTHIGGYNTRWNARKPHIVAFDKGTTLHIKLKRTIEIDENATYFVGERTSEGYGEAKVAAFDTLYSDNTYYEVRGLQSANKSQVAIVDNDLGRRICESLLVEYITTIAIAVAKKCGKEKADVIRPTVRNMLIMCSENNSVDEVVSVINERFDKSGDGKKNKREVALSIIDAVKESAKNLGDNFADKYSISGFEYDAANDMILLKQTLIQLKYLIREYKNSEGGQDE